MLRVVVRYKEDSAINKIKQYGNIIFQSKLIKTLGVETTEGGIKKIKKIPGVISVEHSAKGRLLPMRA